MKTPTNTLITENTAAQPASRVTVSNLLTARFNPFDFAVLSEATECCSERFTIHYTYIVKLRVTVRMNRHTCKKEKKITVRDIRRENRDNPQCSKNETAVQLSGTKLMD